MSSDKVFSKNLFNPENYGSGTVLQRIKRFYERTKDRLASSSKEVKLPPSVMEKFPTFKPVFAQIVLFAILVIFIALVACLVRIRELQYVDPKVCTTKDCVQNAGAMFDWMNMTQNPCENFYQYACGNHYHPYQSSEMKKAPSTSSDRTPVSTRPSYTEILGYNDLDLYGFNRFAVEHLTEMNIRSVVDHVERKDSITDIEYTASWHFSRFYHTCKPHRTDEAKGRMLDFSLLDKINQINGLYLLANNVGNATKKGYRNLDGNYYESYLRKSSRFQLKTNMSTGDVFVQYIKTFGTHPLYQLHAFDYTGTGKYKLLPPVWEMRWSLKHLMSHIAVSNFMSSNEASARAMKIANDFLQIASNLTSYEDWGTVKLMDLGHLQHVLSGLNLKEELKELLPSMANQLDDTMDLYVLGNKHVELIGKFLQNLNNNMDNETRSRVLNSLMLVHSFLQYAPVFDEAYLEIISSFYGGINAENLNEACMVLSHHYMRPIFGYIFVNLHFDSFHTEQMKLIAESIRDEALKLTDKITWLDSFTRDNIKKVLQELRIIVGPEAESQSTEALLTNIMNGYTPTGYLLEDVIALEKWRNRRLSEKLAGIIFNELYFDSLGLQFFGQLLHFRSSKKIYVPLGMLQPPLYRPDTVGATNFGAVGELVAMELVIAALGYRIQPTSGSYSQSFELSSSKNEYTRRWGCYLDELKQRTVKYHDNWWANHYLNASTYLFTKDANTVMLEEAALDISFKSFIDWMATNTHERSDNVFIGPKLNVRKLFFISFAQTFCHSMSSLMELYLQFFATSSIPSEVLVNYILAQNEAFKAEFGCKLKSGMGVERSCEALY